MPPMTKVVSVQLTATVVALPPASVAAPPVTTHVCAGVMGLVLTVTAKFVPSVRGVAKTKVPSADTGRSSPPLSWSTRPVPERPITEPPTVNLLVTQATATLVAFAPASVPVPLVTVQTCERLVGCVFTVTAYMEASVSGVEKANVPFAFTVMSLPPLFWSTRPLPARPDTDPPTVKVFDAQLITTVVTLPEAIVPVPPVTLHVCDGAVGWFFTVTAKALPGVSFVGKTNAPFAFTARSSPPLSCSTRPVPRSPLTDPLTA